ncbi:hypothetical protein ACLOJK_011304 [Asimina triloba]
MRSISPPTTVPHHLPAAILKSHPSKSPERKTKEKIVIFEEIDTIYVGGNGRKRRSEEPNLRINLFIFSHPDATNPRIPPFDEDFPMGSTSRFRFRDRGIGDSSESDTSLESSLGSGGLADDDSDLQSMTAKGIKRLCSELLELQMSSDDDFHKKAEVIEKDLMQLKKHLLTQRRLVRDLMDGIYLDALSEELIDPNTEEDSGSELCSPGTLETHTGNIKETLDVLLSEHRLEEALLILEGEPKTLQNIQSQEDFPPETISSHNNMIMEGRKRLADQFAMVAEHPRITAPELHRSLSGLYRLCDHHRANLLLLQFYRSRIAHGIHDLQHSEPYLHETYIRELAKFVFSVISQAATSFISLYGETSPYASELILWARQETENFACYFGRYVKSISETTGGISLAVESVKHTISFCSMLDSQRILLRPYLIKLIRPCVEGVLQMHLEHERQVIDIFTGTDSWLLSKFRIAELLRDRHSYVATAGEVEFCLLTNSGRKFITMVQWQIMRDPQRIQSTINERILIPGLFQYKKQEINSEVLFLQLRELEKLAKDIFVGVDWLLEELLKELMEALFVWLLNNQEFWTGTRESSIMQQSSNFNQSRNSIFLVLIMGIEVSLENSSTGFSENYRNQATVTNYVLNIPDSEDRVSG